MTERPIALLRTSGQIVVAIALLIASEAAALRPATLISMNSAGTASGDSNSSASGITPSGRFVLFASGASDLVATPKTLACPPYSPIPCADVFVRELHHGTTTLVSVNSAGTASGNGTSVPTAITPNGRFVLFSSSASDLVTNDTNGRSDAFIRDRKLGTTTLVSVNSSATASGNADSGSEGISSNGRLVLFWSLASDLVANDTNGSSDVFVRDLKLGTTTLVSVNSAATASGNGSSDANGITPDGRFVLFSSTASDLVADDTNGSADVLVRDLRLGTTTLVSVNSGGTASGNGTSVPTAITPNGRFVLFSSSASDLVASGTDGRYNVFVRDLKLGTTTLVSVNRAALTGGNSGSDTFGGAITPNGRFVLFESVASDLVATPKGNLTACIILHVGFPCDDVFVRDLKLGITTLASVNSGGTASGNGNSRPNGITADGRFALFSSTAPDLVANDSNGSFDVFVRDLKLGTTALVSVNSAGTGSGNSGSDVFSGGITPNGRFVLFESQASDLVGDDGNGNSDVFVRQLR